jgi:hypothetical protein
VFASLPGTEDPPLMKVSKISSEMNAADSITIKLIEANETSAIIIILCRQGRPYYIRDCSDRC